MRKTDWGKPASWDTICRRASGRRKYNAVRQARAQHRQHEVIKLLQKYGWRYGVGTRIAAELHVSSATITRDMKAIRERMAPCPRCGRV